MMRFSTPTIVGEVPGVTMVRLPDPWRADTIAGGFAHTGGTVRDDVVRLQETVGSHMTATAVVVEGCRGKLDTLTSAAWDATAKKALAFSSIDVPHTGSYDDFMAEGAGVLSELNAWGPKLRSLGCSAAPPPAPVPAPPPSGGQGENESGGQGENEWATTIQWVAIAAVVVAGVYFLSPIAMTAIAFVPKPRHAEARVARAKPQPTADDLAALDRLRLGEGGVSEAKASHLVSKGWVYWLGGEPTISERGREVLLRSREW